MDAIRGEKAARDAPGQAVLIDRVAEVIASVDAVLPSRRRGHADLALLARTTPGFPASCRHRGCWRSGTRPRRSDEEVPRILAVQAGAVLVAGDGLMDGEGPFHSQPHDRDPGVATLVHRARRMVPIPLTLHAVGDPQTRQLVARRPRTVGGVRIQRRLVTQQKPVALPAVVDVARRHRLASATTDARSPTSLEAPPHHQVPREKAMQTAASWFIYALRELAVSPPSTSSSSGRY